MKSLLICCLLACASQVWGHIGSPNVYFEGKAGPFPIRVVIRPPGVVPGVAEINVRVLGGTARRVTALPVYWNAGREGAPPADTAIPVRGQTNLFAATLWLMKPGAYSIDVTVDGSEGAGTVLVPVDSIATNRNGMAPWFTAMLATLGAILFLAAVKLVGAAFGEAILDPGVEFSKKLRWRSRRAMAGGTILFSCVLLFGKAWWDFEDRDYRNNRLYNPVPISASVRIDQMQPIMRLAMENSRARDWTPLIPDHGKLMHLFLVREPELDAFAHLHPVQIDAKSFDVALPPIPEGNYRIYADVVHENGSSDTLTALLEMPRFPESFRRLWQQTAEMDAICSSTWWVNMRTNLVLTPDPDDSWHLEQPGKTSAIELRTKNEQVSRLAPSYEMIWQKDARLVANRETSLQFKLSSPRGSAPLEPYMGMLGHAALRRNDGAVFAHVHPTGTFSMASQQVLEQRETSGAVERVTGEPIKDAPPSNDLISHSNHVAMSNTVSTVSFPYEFPKPGSYRIWVQLKSEGRVFTGVFDTEVASVK